MSYLSKGYVNASYTNQVQEQLTVTNAVLSLTIWEHLMKFTYSKLRESIPHSDKSKQVVRNQFTALNQWLQTFNLSMDHPVEPNLGAAFDSHLMQFSSWLTAKGLAQATINGRLTLMRAWQRLYLDKRAEIAPPGPFAEALREAVESSGKTISWLGRSIGVTNKTLASWVNGSRNPRRFHVNKLQQLEAMLGLKENYLVARIPHFFNHPELLSNSCSPIPYRESLNEARKSPYKLKLIPDRLMEEWKDYLVYKTGLTPRGVKRASSWRTKDASKVPTKYGAHATTGNLVCPTADVCFQAFQNFFGFLLLPVNKGGKGLDESVLTLATCSDSDLVLDFLQFMRSRCGVYNGQSQYVLASFKSMLRPDYGYLWQFTKYGKKFWKGELDKPAWQEHCKEAYEHLSGTTKNMEDAGLFKRSRSPVDPIKNILDMQHPILALKQLARRMELSLPPPEWKSELAVFKRDILIIKMMTSNPLRVSNFSIMTYRKDNAGHLYQKPDGSWWLTFSPEEFKNQRGAAKEPYDMRLSPLVWGDIQEYLGKHRQYLAGAQETDYVFRPKLSSCRSYQLDMFDPDNLCVGIQKRTKMFIPNCAGFRSHAFRHIVATDFIKNHPESFLIAASILHDQIKTVMNNYSHLKKADSFETYNRYLDELDEKL